MGIYVIVQKVYNYCWELGCKLWNLLSGNLTGENVWADNHQRKTTNIVAFISDRRWATDELAVSETHLAGSQKQNQTFPG